MPKNTAKKPAKNAPSEALALAESQPVALRIPSEMIAASALDACIYFATQARRAAVVEVASQIIAGLAAAATKKAMQIAQGSRSDLADDPRLAKGWAGFCKTSLGVSESTVERWIRMAAVVAAKLKKLEWLTLESMEHFATMKDDQFAELTKAVKGAVEGKAQTQLLLEWGLVNGGAKRAITPGGADPYAGANSECPLPGYTPEEWSEWIAADEVLREAIDHARSLRSQLRQFTGAAKVAPHIPSAYRADLRVALAEAAQMLAEVVI